MTALAQYQRLEATGLWRETAQAKPREVVVSFGQATLVLSDPATETPLTHWSLPAVTNLSRGKHPAIYAPNPVADDADPDETLTISDPDMIDAIARVHRAIDTALPHPGRLRRRLSMAAVISIVLIGVFWLPGAMVKHTIRIVPPAQRSLVGEVLLEDLTRVTGPVCRRKAGDTVLARLADRLAPATDIEKGDAQPQFWVVPGGIHGAMPLPGGIIVIGPDLLGVKAQEVPADTTADLGPEPDHSALTSDRPRPRPKKTAQQTATRASPGPDILAGAILAAMQSAQEHDPLVPALSNAGPWASLSLLLRGSISPESLRGHGFSLIGAEMPRPQDSAALMERFAAASVSPQAYARQRDQTDPVTLALLEQDPFRDQPAPRAILSDSEWEALREICEPR